MKVISLLNMKGGVGKTTTSINLAAGLADKGYNVLLVDLDPQGNTTSQFLSDEPDITISDVLLNSTSLEEIIYSAEERIDVVPANLYLSAAEMTMRMETNIPQHNRLKKALITVKDKYDYCVIDCPPILNLLTANSIIASSLVVVPIKPDSFALSGFSLTNQNIQQIRENWELNISSKILFTMVNRNVEEQDIIFQLREMSSDAIFESQIRNQAKPIIYANLNKKAVVRNFSKNASVAEDYRKFVLEIENTYINEL